MACMLRVTKVFHNDYDDDDNDIHNRCTDYVFKVILFVKKLIFFY